MEIVQIKKSELVDLINSGKTKKEIAKHYGVPDKRITEGLQKLKLRIKSFKGQRAEFIDDMPNNTDEPVRLTTITTDSVAEDNIAGRYTSTTQIGNITQRQVEDAYTID